MKDTIYASKKHRHKNYGIKFLVKYAVKGLLVGALATSMLMSSAIPPAVADTFHILPFEQSQVLMLDTHPVLAQASVKAQQPIQVYVNGKLVEFPDQQPYIDKNNRTLVPVRFVSESLGAKVGWDGKLKQVTVRDDGVNKTIKLWVGKSYYEINGQRKNMDTAAVMTSKSRVMVPVRFVSEALGATVSYQEVAGLGLVFTFTREYPKEDINKTIKEIVDTVKKDNSGSYSQPSTTNTYGWVKVSEDAKSYGFAGLGVYEKHRMSFRVSIENRDEAKVRAEMERIITACGYTKSEAKQVIDYALSKKEDREIVLDKLFFLGKFSSKSFIRVSSGMGFHLVDVTISK